MVVSSIAQTQQQAVLGIFFVMIPIMLHFRLRHAGGEHAQWLQHIAAASPLKHYLIIVQWLFSNPCRRRTWSNVWPLLIIAAVSPDHGNGVCAAALAVALSCPAAAPSHRGTFGCINVRGALFSSSLCYTDHNQIITGFAPGNPQRRWYHIMKKLSLIDSAFLMLESRETPMHVGGFNLFTFAGGADEQSSCTGWRPICVRRMRCSRPLATN